MARKEAPLSDLLRIASRRFAKDRCIQIASSLTFTTLLSLVPIVTVTLSVVSVFPVFNSLLRHLQSFVLDNLVPKSVDAISGYAAQFSDNAARLTAVGLVFLCVTALMLMFTIDRAFNDIWRVSRPRPLLQRILVYWTVLTVGPLFIGASLSATSYVVTLSLGLVDETVRLQSAVLLWLPLALTSLAFALIYLTVPNRPVARRDAFIGGISAGVCFEAMKEGFGFYVAHFPTNQLVYGAFAMVPIFLLWIYLSWLITLGGAVLVAVLPEWRLRAGQSRPVPGSDFFDALQILKLLWHAHRNGRVVSLFDLHARVSVRLERLEKILDSMAGAGWVVRHGALGWVLCRDAGSIKLNDVFRRFVFRRDARASSRQTDHQFDSIAHEISAQLDVTLETTLEHVFMAAPRAAPAKTV